MKKLNRFIDPLKRRVQMMVARAVVNLVYDGLKLQEVQLGVMKNETREGVERFQEYGFTSHPLAGAEAVVLFVGGNRDHGLVIAVDDRRYRLKPLEAGEVAIYTDEGDYIKLGRGGTITMVAATKVRIESPLVEVTGDLKDNCDSQPNNVRQMREIYNAHTNPPGGGTPQQM